MSPIHSLRNLLAIISHHLVLERLFFASFEFAVLALLIGFVIRVSRIRSARLISVLWLLVLAKPIASLAIGSPFPIVQFEAPASEQSQTDLQSSPELAAAGENRPELRPASSLFMDADRGAFSQANPVMASSAVQTDVADSRAIGDAAGDDQTRRSLSQAPWLWFQANAARTAFIAWLAGLVFFVLLSVLDRIRLHRLVKAARAPHSDLSTRYASIAASLGVKRLPRLRETDDLESPALAGVLAPVILVPAWLVREQELAKLDWSLRHELMHWKLLDPLANVVRELAQTLFYFHPAAWWVGKKWEEAVELACDRAIVNNETDSQDYAEQLYQMLVKVRNHRRLHVNSGLFATRTQIGRRIAALLGSPVKSPAQLSLFALTCVMALSAVTLMVGGTFVDASAQRHDAQTASKGDSRFDPQSTTESINDAKVVEDNIVISGRVLDLEGKPFAGARVFLSYDSIYFEVRSKHKGPPKLRTTTGPDGRFSFTEPKSEFQDSFWFDAWNEPRSEATVVAQAEGFGPAWIPIGKREPATTDLTLRCAIRI